MKNYLQKREGQDLFQGFFEPFDEFFAPIFRSGFEKMRTDLRETDKGYEMEIDMPGLNKEDIELSLENGYLTVSSEKKEYDNSDGYIRRERETSFRRSYFVGDNVKEEDVKAKYDKGILFLSFPKKEEKKAEIKRIKID